MTRTFLAPNLAETSRKPSGTPTGWSGSKRRNSVSRTFTPVSASRRRVSRKTGPSRRMSYGGTPTLGVAVSRIPIVRNPAAAATVTSSGGVVSSTVRWAREISLSAIPRLDYALARRCAYVGLHTMIPPRTGPLEDRPTSSDHENDQGETKERGHENKARGVLRRGCDRRCPGVGRLRRHAGRPASRKRCGRHRRRRHRRRGDEPEWTGGWRLGDRRDHRPAHQVRQDGRHR